MRWTELHHRRTIHVLAVSAAIGGFSIAASASPDHLDPVSKLIGAIPVEAMSPSARVAYLVGIRSELSAHGYAPGAAGDLSDSIRAYQHDAGLAVNGIASQGLLDHLMFAWPRVEAVHMAARGPAATVRPMPPAILGDIPPRKLPEAEQSGRGGHTNAAPSGTMPRLPRGRVQSEALPPGDETVSSGETRTGAVGGVISRVQKALRSRRYYDGPVDGVFGADLKAAVRRFQRDRGLNVTGVADARLLNALSLPKSARR